MKEKNFIKGAPQGSPIRPGAQFPKPASVLSGGGNPLTKPIGTIPLDKPQIQMAPKSMGQGDNAFPQIHDQGIRQALAQRGAGAPPMGAPANTSGNYGGFEDNYFREARGNSPYASEPQVFNNAPVPGQQRMQPQYQGTGPIKSAPRSPALMQMGQQLANEKVKM